MKDEDENLEKRKMIERMLILLMPHLYKQILLNGVDRLDDADEAADAGKPNEDHIKLDVKAGKLGQSTQVYSKTVF